MSSGGKLRLRRFVSASGATGVSHPAQYRRQGRRAVGAKLSLVAGFLTAAFPAVATIYPMAIPLCLSTRDMVFEVPTQGDSNVLSAKQASLLKWYLENAGQSAGNVRQLLALDTQYYFPVYRVSHPDFVRRGASAMLLLVSQRDCTDKCAGTALYEDRQGLPHRADFFYGSAIPIEYSRLQGQTHPSEIRPDEFTSGQFVLFDANTYEMLILADVWGNPGHRRTADVIGAPANFAFARHRLMESKQTELRLWPGFYQMCLSGRLRGKVP